jgi:anthranilate 1,2-dioxygenase large subunit
MGSSNTSVSAPENLIWPSKDFSRVPYEVFYEQSIYDQEMENIFHGPTWNYLAHESEIPNTGDFVTNWICDTNVIVNRTTEGNIRAFRNSCSHRGTRIVDEIRGNATRHVCPYHLWNFNLEGDLAHVPLEEGLKGKGGMPPCFSKADHNLQKLRVETIGGMIFGTFSDATEPLADYLGPHCQSQISRLLGQRTPKVTGYMRQMIPGNWKLYNENVRDPYHASLLHLFQVSFGIQQPSMKGGIKLDKDSKNTWNHSILSEKDKISNDDLAEAYEGTGKYDPNIKLADPAIANVPLDLDDGYKSTLLSMFPTSILAQVDNTYAIRHLRPKGPDKVELNITYLGFEEDTDEQAFGKNLTANFIGPSGYISMEDGEALRLEQEGLKMRAGEHSVLEMGGIGPIEDTDYLSQEISIRGFWSYYHHLMQFSG